MKKVKYADIKNTKINLINVDDKYEYSVYHLPGAINIPYDTLISNYRSLLNKNVKYYINCKNGIKSKRAVIILEYLGYDVVMLEN